MLHHGQSQRLRLIPMLAALAVTQTVGYGALYYSFAVILTPLAADLHVSTATVTGALSLAMLVTAAMGIPVGRWLDRHGGAGLMTAGSGLATLGLLAWSHVDSVAELYGVFAFIGAASAMVLYEPAFAVVVRHLPAQRRSRALLTITMVAGLASSIFLPLTGALVEHLGWRDAVLCLAGIHAVVTIPLHAVFVPRRGTPTTPLTRTASPSRGAVGFVLRERSFWLLVATFVVHGTAISTVSVHLVAALMWLGHPPTFAAGVAGLLGLLSVTGRASVTAAHRRWSIVAITVVVFAAQAVAAVMLPVVGVLAIGAVGCVVLFGLGFGVSTIARPLLLAERYGTAAYATIAGTLALPVTIAKAGAPLAAALLATTFGYAPVLVLVGVACASAAGLLALSARRTLPSLAQPGDAQRDVEPAGAQARGRVGGVRVDLGHAVEGKA